MFKTILIEIKATENLHASKWQTRTSLHQLKSVMGYYLVFKLYSPVLARPKYSWIRRKEFEEKTFFIASDGVCACSLLFCWNFAQPFAFCYEFLEWLVFWVPVSAYFWKTTQQNFYMSVRKYRLIEAGILWQYAANNDIFKDTINKQPFYWQGLSDL